MRLCTPTGVPMTNPRHTSATLQVFWWSDGLKISDIYWKKTGGLLVWITAASDHLRISDIYWKKLGVCWSKYLMIWQSENFCPQFFSVDIRIFQTLRSSDIQTSRPPVDFSRYKIFSDDQMTRSSDQQALRSLENLQGCWCTDNETCWWPLVGRRAEGTTVSLHPHSYSVCHQTILVVQRIPIADLHPRSCSTQCVNLNPATCTSIVVPMVGWLVHWQ